MSHLVIATIAGLILSACLGSIPDAESEQQQTYDIPRLAAEKQSADFYRRWSRHEVYV